MNSKSCFRSKYTFRKNKNAEDSLKLFEKKTPTIYFHSIIVIYIITLVGFRN